MADLFPLAKTDDLLAGFYVPGDGRVNPVDLTMSLVDMKGSKTVSRSVAGTPYPLSVTSIVTWPPGCNETNTGMAVAPVLSAISAKPMPKLR